MICAWRAPGHLVVEHVVRSWSDPDGKVGVDHRQLIGHQRTWRNASLVLRGLRGLSLCLSGALP